MKKIYSYIEIAKILANKKNGEISAKEEDILDKWLAEKTENKKLFDDLQNDIYISEEINLLKTYDTTSAYENVAKKLVDGNNKILGLTRNFYRYAAAVTLLVIGSYLVFTLINGPNQVNLVDSSILPGTQKAILTTASNEVIELGESSDDNIFLSSKTEVTDENSTIKYTAKEYVQNPNEELEFNQLETPRGGEYSVILADGTTVHLNSETVLNYPVVFIGDTREVTLEGEAYFEVTKSTSIPFVVNINNISVTVYGTSFNISAYKSATEIQTTLVEGSVGIKHLSDNDFKEIIIAPGQQASYEELSGEVKIRQVDTYLYTAWVYGEFAFENEPLVSLLTKLSRWYDFEYNFEDEDLENQRFTGRLKRYENIDQILKMISMTSKVELKIEKEKIRVYSIDE